MLRKQIKPIVCGCAALLISGSAVRGESLWQKRTPERGFLFYDSKARNIGDNVTVVIAQNTDVANKEGRNLQKATTTRGSFDVAGQADGGFGDQDAKAGLDLNATSSRKFDGGATYSAAQEFTDRMTVTVMDVLPNGNMVISGQRRLRVAGEERTLLLSGVIRGLDIGPDNTIHSRYISELRLDYETGGPSQKFTRQGWLGRAVNAVWPF